MSDSVGVIHFLQVGSQGFVRTLPTGVAHLFP